MRAPRDFAEMGAYNEELVKAGIMLAGDGLTRAPTGARVRFDADGSSTVVDGPFAETKELIAGFWILEVSSSEEVVEWVRKAPFRDGEVEIRQVVRGRGLRRRLHARAARAGGPDPRDIERARPEPVARRPGPPARSGPSSDRDRRRRPGRRRRLADGVGPPRRRPGPRRPATSGWPRSWPRTRWSPRSSSGRRPASPTKPGRLADGHRQAPGDRRVPPGRAAPSARPPSSAASWPSSRRRSPTGRPRSTSRSRTTSCG